MPSIAPTPAASAAPPTPEIALVIPGDHALPGDLPSMAPSPAAAPATLPGSLELPPSSPLPAFGGGAMPSFSPPPPGPMTIPMDPMAGAVSGASADPTNPSLAVMAPAAAVVDAATGEIVAAPAPGGRKKALIFGGLFGLLALGAFVFISGGLGKKKPSVPAGIADTAPLPTPAPPAPVLLPPTPPPSIDPRETAIEAAKEWELPDGRRLGQALEALSPPIGNLSPWMAEPLTDDRLSVNYFAHGGGSGAPTVAYEFEVDLAAKTVAGRNPAAKAVIAGKAVPPPAPPKSKKITLKPKAKTPKPKPKEENLDSLLGSSSAAPKAEAPLAGPAAAPAKPAKPTTAKRAAKASAKSAAPAATGKAADEALLDDILKE